MKLKLYDMETIIPDRINKYGNEYCVANVRPIYDPSDVYSTVRRIRENFPQYRFTTKKYHIEKIPVWIVYERRK